MVNGNGDSMKNHVATDQPIYYTVTGVIAGVEVHEDGFTQVGDDTACGEALTMRADANPMAYLGALLEIADEFPPLPDVGQPVEALRVYRHGDTLLMARQSHTRRHFAPEETPALFAIWRGDLDDELPWVYREWVYEGQRREHEGIVYKTNTTHQTFHAPPTAPAIWTAIVDPSTPQPWKQPTGAHDAYRVGVVVTHKGRVWECVAGDANGNNVWEPGVYGWKIREDR